MLVALTCYGHVKMGQAETIGDCLAAYVFYFRCFRTGFRSVTEYPTTSEIGLDGFSVPLLLATQVAVADPRSGVWLVGCGGERPRQLVAAHRFGPLVGVQYPLGIAASPSLSWSCDGRSVLIAVGRGLIAVDVATGRARALMTARAIQASIAAAAYAPAAAELFYLADRGTLSEADSTIVVTDARGPRPRAQKHTTALLTSPAWAPDGRSIAYLWQRHLGPGTRAMPRLEVRVVDRATGRVHRVALPPLPLSLQSGEQAQALLTWLPARR